MDEQDFVIFVGPTREQCIADGILMDIPRPGLFLPEVPYGRVITVTTSLWVHTKSLISAALPDAPDHIVEVTVWPTLGIAARDALLTPDNPDGYLLTSGLNDALPGEDKDVWFVRDSGAGYRDGETLESYTAMRPQDY